MRSARLLAARRALWQMRLYLAESVERSAVWQPVHRDLEVRAAYMRDAAIMSSPKLISKAVPVLDFRLSEFRHFIGGLLAIASLNHACEVMPITLARATNSPMDVLPTPVALPSRTLSPSSG